jgi:hypothetical protein
MSYYAKIINGLVADVIVCDAFFLKDSPDTWIETFMDGKTRGNYAGVGYTYDAINDVFYAPKPYASWILSNWEWVSPTPYPSDNKMYSWNEESKSWVIV